MKYLITTIMLMLLTGASCKKNKTEEQLPPETHEGKFTFGCKVDGKIYTASGKGGGALSFDHVYYSLGSQDSSLHIFAGTTSELKNKFSVSFSIKYINRIGIYLMKTYPYEGKFYDESNGNLPSSSNTYTTTDGHVGKIDIKYFDGTYTPYNEGTILSGTFEIDAVNGNGKLIHLTEGRFDIGQ